MAQPTITKAFSNGTAFLGGAARTLTITVANPNPVAIPEPTKGYDLLRWDLAASSRLVEGRQDATVSITMTPCRILQDGSVDEASESKRR